MHRLDRIEPGSGWSEFYQAYPRKESKADGIRAWNALTLTPELLARILADIEERLATGLWCSSDRKHIPLPATYINAKRWEDELEPNATSDLLKRAI